MVTQLLVNIPLSPPSPSRISLPAIHITTWASGGFSARFWTGSGRLERPQFIQLGPWAEVSKGWGQIGRASG